MYDAFNTFKIFRGTAGEDLCSVFNCMRIRLVLYTNLADQIYESVSKNMNLSNLPSYHEACKAECNSSA